MMPSRRKTLSLILMLATHAVAAWAQSTPIPIRQSDIPMEITAPGDYRLAEDILSPASAAAIIITADDVRIDLEGSTITGPGRSADQPAFAITTAPNAELHRVTITGGTLRDFPTSAISLPRVTHATIHNVSIFEIGEVAIDVGDEATIRSNRLQNLGIEDATRTGAVIAIRAGLNSTIEQNSITDMHHSGNGPLDAIRVDRGCYVMANRIENLSTADSGTGDVIAIACATMAADIRANRVARIANSRPGGIGIGIRIGSGSAEENHVSDVSAASLAIGLQGIAAVFIERNEVHGVRTIRKGPDAYGIWAAGTGGRITSNVVSGVDCQGDELVNREVGIRANSAFEIAGNRIHLPHARTRARQAGIEISGRYNVIVENVIVVGDASAPRGVAVLLGPLTFYNTVGGNETRGIIDDRGTGNRAPDPAGEVPML